MPPADGPRLRLDPDLGSFLGLLESTAEWAASYVAHVTPPIEDDGNFYAHALPRFPGDPANLLNAAALDTSGRQYGAWIFDEYLVDEANGGLGASVIKEIWTELTDHPQAPLAAIEQVLSQHTISLAAVLPEFWRANYLLAYSDTDAGTVWA